MCSKTFFVLCRIIVGHNPTTKTKKRKYLQIFKVLPGRFLDAAAYLMFRLLRNIITFACKFMEQKSSFNFEVF